MDKLKVGMIGCGVIAGVHAKWLSTIKEVKLKAFADVVKEKAKAFSTQYGGRVYRDWHEMLEKEKLDIVYICLPPLCSQGRGDGCR